MTDSTFAERTERFINELMKERYEVTAGLKDGMDLSPIYERHADLFVETTVRERIGAFQQLLVPNQEGPAQTATAPSAAKSEQPSSAGIQPASREAHHALKEARYLADFALNNYVENSIKELTESIARAELAATVEWNEQQIPYRNIRAVLARASDHVRRHDLSGLYLAVLARQNPLRFERIQAQHELAKLFGFANYRKMIEWLRGWDLSILLKALDPLLEETEDVFESNLDRLLTDAHVPRKKAETSDMLFALRAPQYDSFFPASQLLAVMKKSVAAFGLPLESTPGLRLDNEPRAGKFQGAICVPVRVPSEVYLVSKPIGGYEDYRALLHEAGHAEHYSHVDEAIPFAFKYLGEEAISETFALLLEQLTLTPRWLVDIVRIPVLEAERFQRFALFKKLWLVRRSVAKFHYELVLHDEGPSGVDTAYRDILSDALHVRVAPERYLEDVDDGFRTAGHLRAWIFQRQLAMFMLNRFGEGWYESLEAGKFLRSMWSVGTRDPVDEMAITRIGAKGLDPTPLIEELANI